MPHDQLQKTQNAVETARANLAAAEQRRAEVLAEIETLTAAKASLPFSEAKIAEHFAKMRAAHDKRDVAEQMLDTAKTALASAEANASEIAWECRIAELNASAKDLTHILRTRFPQAAAELIEILGLIRDFNASFSAFAREALRQGRPDLSVIQSPLHLTDFEGFDTIIIRGPGRALLWPAESPAQIAAREAKEAFQREEARRADAARGAAVAKRDADYEGRRTWVP